MQIESLEIAADPQAWRELGFEVCDEGVAVVGSVRLRLAGAQKGRGIVGCALLGASGAGIDGLPTEMTVREPAETGSHPVGATHIDHVVVITPDLPRTFAALEAAGTELRRVRDFTAPDGSPARQGFFRLGEVILEVAGPATASGDGRATFWGLTLTVEDLDAAAALLGERLGRAKDAVQPGRRIGTVRREAGAGVPLALITPHVSRDERGGA